MAGRQVYKLGEHRLRLIVADVQAGTKRRQYVAVPILTRCLEKTGELLKLDKATENDLKILKQIKTRPRTPDEVTPEGEEEEQQPGEGEGEIRQVIYYRIGSWRAESIRLVYKQKIEEEGEGSTENEGQEEGENQEGEQEERYKIRVLHIPVPSWAPNYKVIPVLFNKARAAELKVVGAYRKGALIPMPNQGS